MSIQKRTKISSKEMVALLTMYVVTQAFLSYPEIVSQSGLEAAWMEPLISGVLALIAFVMIQALTTRYFHGLALLEIVKEAMGKWFAVLIGLICAAYLMATTASVMRQFEENVLATVLPLTPILWVGLLFTVVIWYMAYCGLEGIARTALVLLPVLLIGLLALCLMTINWWKPFLLAPVWGAGSTAVEAGSLRYASVFSNVLLLCVIYPHAHDDRSFRRVGILSIGFSSIILAGFICVFHMVFSATQATHMSFHMYQLARMIYLGRFFQRMESVFIFMWVSAAVVKMAFTLWASAYLLALAFDWPTFRPILPALALIALSVGMLPSDVMQAIVWEQTYLLGWGWIVVFVIPLGVILLASLRKAGRRRRVRHV